MNIYNSSTKNGLFNIQGQAFRAVDTLNTACGTTVPAVVQAAMDQLNLVAPIPSSYEVAGQNIPVALSTWQSAGGSLAASLLTFTQTILQAFVANDVTLIDTSLTAALNYVVSQMVAGGYYVTPNVVGATLTPGSNTGDTVVAWTLARGDGKQQQNAIAETLTLTVNANPSAATPSINCVGVAMAQTSNYNWPQGSGVNRSFAACNPGSSLLANGGFESAANANVPDNWIITVGTPGTKIILTAPEQQTVAIGGTPTGGSYLLLYTDRSGNVRATPSIAYNATAGTVQAALQTIAELSAVNVSTAGTTPNYTHTIVFAGVGGSLSALTYVDNMTGGTHSISVSTTVAGDASDYRGVSLKLVGDGSTLQTLYQPLSRLAADTVYFVHLRARRSGAATGAVLKVAVVQQIGGTALDDDAGNANELIIACSGLSNSASSSEWFSFRLPSSAILPVYLRLSVTTAIPSGSYVYVDEVAVTAGTEIYSGGPVLAAFSGRLPAAAGDSWTLAVTNTHAGIWQDCYQRTFDMATKGLLLPTTGTTLIPNSVELYPA